VNFQLYGYEDEILLFDKFVEAIKKNNGNEMTKTINNLIKLTKGKIRKELKLTNFYI